MSSDSGPTLAYPTPPYAWTSLIESPEDHTTSPAAASVSPPDGPYFTPPSYVSRDSNSPEHAAPSISLPTIEHGDGGGGEIAVRRDLGGLGSGLLEDVIDPELLVPRILKAYDEEGQTGNPGQSSDIPPLGLDVLGGQSSVPFTAMRTMHGSSRQEPPSLLSPLTMPRPKSPGSAGMEIKAHCCSFIAQHLPPNLSSFRLRLLTWAASLSHWPGFLDIHAEAIPLPLSRGQWLYEVGQYSHSPHFQGETLGVLRGLIMHRIFYDGGNLTVPPRVVRFSPDRRLLRRLYQVEEHLEIWCNIPGHGLMTVTAWMGVEDYNYFREIESSGPPQGCLG